MPNDIGNDYDPSSPYLTYTYDPLISKTKQISNFYSGASVEILSLNAIKYKVKGYDKEIALKIKNFNKLNFLKILNKTIFTKNNKASNIRIIPGYGKTFIINFFNIRGINNLKDMREFDKIDFIFLTTYGILINDKYHEYVANKKILMNFFNKNHVLTDKYKEKIINDELVQMGNLDYHRIVEFFNKSDLKPYTNIKTLLTTTPNILFNSEEFKILLTEINK